MAITPTLDIGTAVAGAGSLIGGIGSLFNKGSSVEQQQAWQERMMDKQQAYWKQQFDYINEYNKPSNVAKRYFEAGASPSAAFGGSSVGQATASPTLGGSGSPVGFPPTMQNGAQMFSTIAQALSSLGSAFKNTAEGKSIMRKTVGPDIGVKASGGVRDSAGAIAMVEAGASRIGASATIAILSGAKSDSDY